ncbi:MAG: RNA polymerase sigma factor [Deltaproteobacteria bacterium]|nr:RNA polymerase sigma factor [Deltaproteobacteria bacterium]MBW2053205.1 RNA polymerase sigma factor [Deltaproteobacteria bacterium]MBW2142369.1 RNA polymerase sigma factor [Deltaproteobacteria bacterium]MBW2324653.1 RNA polymerase sigma factor [Deltaproteobacteria bacterium]
MDYGDEDRIINDILAGDAEAYGILVKRYQGPIYNLMLRMNFSAEDGLDLSQETFLKAYENLERFKPGSRFFSWLYAIGLNLGRDLMRKQKSPMIPLDEQNYHQPEFAREAEQEKILLKNVDRIKVEEALQELPVKYREALILRYRQELTMSEISAALDISVSGAKMRVHRGLLRLRQTLAEESDAK